jgi:hypothetical protein
MNKLTFYLLGFALFTSCGNAPTNTASLAPTVSLPPNIGIHNQEGGYIEFTLSIASHELIDHGTKYTLLSNYGGTPVGFVLIIKPSGDKKGALSTVIFRSMGDTSNNFVNALASIYQLKHENLRFPDSATASNINLRNFFGNESGTEVAAQNKLTFDTDEVPELLMNIYEGAGTISFPEKDPDNRQGIINAFTRHGKLKHMKS